MFTGYAENRSGRKRRRKGTAQDLMGALGAMGARARITEGGGS